VKYEPLPQDGHIQKIGFGTWTIGGESTADRAHDARGLAALRSAIELGYTHFDTAEMYGAGHCEELLGAAIRDSRVPRDGLFITSKVSPEHLRSAEVLHACDASLRRLGMDYLDLYLIHWPNDAIPLEDTFEALNRLCANGKVRHLGVSNFDLAHLKRSQALSETPILTDQIQYSLSERSYIKDGLLSYCRSNHILLTAYSPVKDGRATADPVLDEIAAAHGAGVYQVALAWLVQQPGVITIPMSINPQHQLENLQAADLELTADELNRLDRIGSSH